MSRPKNDRKFQSQSGKTFQDLDAKGFVTAIAVASKAEFGATTVCAKDGRSADLLKRASRAKLVGGEEWPEWLQPRGSYAPLGSRSENCIGTGGPPRPRLGG